MKGLTLSLLHLHFAFKFPAKIWNFSDSYIWLSRKILGSAEFWVWVKILGLGENSRFGWKLYVQLKILGWGQNFGVGGKI